MELFEYLEMELLNARSRKIEIPEKQNVQDSYELACIQRLLYSFEKILETGIESADFFCALRAYLGYRNDVTLLLPPFLSGNPMISRFNLVRYTNNRFGISGNYPEWMNGKFIERTFAHNHNVRDQKSQYFLGTSPYIQRLMGDDYAYYKNPSQQLAVDGCLHLPMGKTALICLPTGEGKSLITQTVAYQEASSFTLVIVPTVSLAMDQERAAKKAVKHDTDNEIFSYSSEKEKGPLFEALHSHTARLLFISPEAIQMSPEFRDEMEKASKSCYLKNLVIDEAHMVVEWGSSFRLDFQTLESYRNHLMFNNDRLRTFLLSATYDRYEVEVLKKLFSTEGKDWIEIRCDALRPELLFNCIICDSEREKQKKSLQLVDLLPHPMVIYTRRPQEAEELKAKLIRNSYRDILTFTGETNKEDRIEILKAWHENQCNTMIATSAFGLGVDKTDIRTVLHLHVPETPNEYYQEAGRGGRDGFFSLGSMCVQKDTDIENGKNYKGKVLSIEKIIGRWFSMIKYAEKYGLENRFKIDTTLLPEYTTGSTVNQKHVQWNVYVLLFMRRHDFICIENVQIKNEIYDEVNNTYDVFVKILDERILKQNEVSEALIATARDRENEYNCKNYSYISQAVRHSNDRCWSEMLYQVYDKIDEYCGGCNNHLEPKGTLNYWRKLPLKNTLKCQYPETTPQINKIIGSSREALIISSDKEEKILNAMISAGCRGVILTKSCEMESGFLKRIYKENDAKRQIFVINLKELKDLQEREDYYYLAGTYIVLYGLDLKSNSNAVLLTQDVLSSVPSFSIIHVAKEDFKMLGQERMMSECIEGNHFSENIIEVLDNV